MISNSDGSISLLSLANEMFVTAENAGQKPLIANRPTNSQWEMFIMTPNPGKIFFKSYLSMILFYLTTLTT